MANAQVTSSMKVDRDLENRRITLTRHFDATPERVWEAWSDARELEKWWAPKPYKAETKAFNFRPGGRWHYLMAGPNGERQWGAIVQPTQSILHPGFPSGLQTRPSIRRSWDVTTVLTFDL